MTIPHPMSEKGIIHLKYKRKRNPPKQQQQQQQQQQEQDETKKKPSVKKAAKNRKASKKPVTRNKSTQTTISANEMDELTKQDEQQSFLESSQCNTVSSVLPDTRYQIVVPFPNPYSTGWWYLVPWNPPIPPTNYIPLVPFPPPTFMPPPPFPLPSLSPIPFHAPQVSSYSPTSPSMCSRSSDSSPSPNAQRYSSPQPELHSVLPTPPRTTRTMLRTEVALRQRSCTPVSHHRNWEGCEFSDPPTRPGAVVHPLLLPPPKNFPTMSHTFPFQRQRRYIPELHHKNWERPHCSNIPTRPEVVVKPLLSSPPRNTHMTMRTAPYLGQIKYIPESEHKVWERHERSEAPNALQSGSATLKPSTKDCSQPGCGIESAVPMELLHLVNCGTPSCESHGTPHLHSSFGTWTF
ncbi:hypothetical protein RB195_021415 [Necator americanus]